MKGFRKGVGSLFRGNNACAAVRPCREKDSRPRKGSRRKGSVLLIVLIVVALFTLSAFTFFDMTFNYRRATDSFGGRVQAAATAESGVEYLINHLKKTPLEIETAGGLYNNPAWFQGVLLMEDPDPRYQARFTVLSPAMLDGVSGDVRFGLENESARINLNTLLLADEGEEGNARDLLMNLPGMTEFIADSILDWLDEDDLAREYGAELQYYSALDPPYAPANGPLTTIEELLLVQGVTPELLYGADVNRNYYIDQDEAGRQTFATAVGADGSMNRGWSAFFTLHSAESNIRADGTPKIDVNGDDLETLHEELLVAGLTEAQANFIIAYRQGGAFGGDDDDDENEEGEEEGEDEEGDREGGGQREEEEEEGGRGGPGRGRGGDGDARGGRGGGQGSTRTRDAADLELDFAAQGNQRLTTILDLIGTRTRVVESGQTDRTIVNEEFPESDMAEFLPLLMENLSVNANATIPGRININQASRAVLYGIPELTPDVVEQIIATRDYEVQPNRPERAYETWILTEGIIDLETMKKLMKYVTGGGSVYRAQVVGFFDQQDSPTRRIEVIIDNTTAGSPEMVFWRDLTQLGGGFTPAVLGAAMAEVP